MCCSGGGDGDDLERVLDRLTEMRKFKSRDSGSPNADTATFDTVIVECTGLADPAPILQVLCRAEMDKSGFYLDAVVTVVDALHIDKHLPGLSQPEGLRFTRRSREAEAQIAFADVVIINKGDAVNRVRVLQVQEAVACINPGAITLVAEHADVPLDSILNVGAFNPTKASALYDRASAALASEQSGQGRHTSGVESIVLEADRPLDGEKFGGWIHSLLETQEDNIYRVKGILHMKAHQTALGAFQAYAFRLMLVVLAGGAAARGDARCS